MQRIKQYLIVVVMFLLAACARIPGSTAAPTMPVEPTNVVAATAPANSIPKLNGDWRMMLTQSGGFIGMSKSIQIDASGAATVTDLRSKKTSQAVLPADTLKKLTDLVANSSYKPASMPSGCADCFIFKLEITSGSQKFQVEMNDIDLQTSGLQDLVGFLGQSMRSIEK